MNKKCPDDYPSNAELPTLLSILHDAKKPEPPLPAPSRSKGLNKKPKPHSEKAPDITSKQKLIRSQPITSREGKSVRRKVKNQTGYAAEEEIVNHDGNKKNNVTPAKRDLSETVVNGATITENVADLDENQKAEFDDGMARQLMKTVADRIGPNINWSRVRQTLNFDNWKDEDYAEKYRELLCEQFAEQARLKPASVKKMAAQQSKDELKEFKARDPTKKWKMSCALRKKAFNERGHDLFAALENPEEESSGANKVFRLSFLRDFGTESTFVENEGRLNGSRNGIQLQTRESSSHMPEEVAGILTVKEHDEHDLMHERFIDRHRKHIQSAKARKSKDDGALTGRKSKPCPQPQAAEKLNVLIATRAANFDGPFRRRRVSLEQERECAVTEAELKLIEEELALVEDEDSN